MLEPTGAGAVQKRNALLLLVGSLALALRRRRRQHHRRLRNHGRHHGFLVLFLFSFSVWPDGLALPVVVVVPACTYADAER